MGCCASSAKQDSPAHHAEDAKSTKYSRPDYDLNGMAPEEMQAKREEFWDTQPAYGGSPDIWATIKAALACQDLDTCLLYLQAAEVKVAKPNLTAFYDARGFLYEVPVWAAAPPPADV